MGLPEAGCFGPISGLRTRAALCLQFLFPFPFPFLPPPPLFRLFASPGGGDGARRSSLTAHLPIPVILLGTLCQGGCHTHQGQGSDAGAGVGGRTAEPTSSSPGGVLCCSPASGWRCLGCRQAGLCLPCRQQLLTSLGLLTWRSRPLKVRKNLS